MYEDKLWDSLETTPASEKSLLQIYIIHSVPLLFPCPVKDTQPFKHNKMGSENLISKTFYVTNQMLQMLKDFFQLLLMSLFRLLSHHHTYLFPTVFIYVGLFMTSAVIPHVPPSAFCLFDGASCKDRQHKRLVGAIMHTARPCYPWWQKTVGFVFNEALLYIHSITTTIWLSLLNMLPLSGRKFVKSQRDDNCGVCGTVGKGEVADLKDAGTLLKKNKKKTKEFLSYYLKSCLCSKSDQQVLKVGHSSVIKLLQIGLNTITYSERKIIIDLFFLS